MPSTNDRILTYLTESVRILLRETIDEYAGAEVFFVGRVGETGRVEEAEPFAFGNQEAVPVIEQVVCPGNVVIHNHPGGHLEPSQADIEVASRFGNVGVGSFIIDNEAQNIRIIVPIMKIAECQGLDIAKLEELLSDCGPLARAMNRYERRLEQSRMLRTVAESFNRDGIAVIEAGTGVGKSLAYLIPAIFWAKKNQEKVIISTNTINLQEQLIQKDIPFLQKHLGLEFRAELMKGRGNYLCLRRAAFVRHTPDFFADEQQGAQLFDILEWAAKTPEGSLSSIGFIPDFDIWEQVSCDPDNCTKIRCQFYAKCFFYQARRRAAAADLIVANHHLVMADLAVRQETGNYTSTAVLPAYKRIIFDEAHNIEDVATQYFGIAITRRVMARLLSRLIHREKSRMGLLPFLRDRLVLETYRAPSQNLQDAVQLIEERLVPLRQEIATGVRDLMDTCARGAAEVLRQEPQPGHEIQLRITPNIEDTEFWSQNLRRAVRQTTTAMDEMASGLMKVRNALVKLPEKTRQEYDNPIGELKSISGKLSSRADEFRHFHTISEGRCRWIEVRRARAGNEALVRLFSLPLEIQDDLNSAVYARTPSVVMTSATLTVNGRFDFFLGQVGLDAEHGQADTRERIETQYLETPFDYEKQAFVGVPMDLPEPRAPGFPEAATNFLLPALQISRGGAFILFTSYSQLDRFHRQLAPLLESMGFSCLKQGAENRQALLQRFKNDHSSILFATSSFWEGVDVPGDALRLLILVKLPFRVPTDPLVQARVERLEEKGIDSFQNYSVPQAVIRFKQGFGRLIRTREDKGAVLVLDRRIATKPYGQVFLNSLPSRTTHRLRADELLDELRRFFRRES